MQRHNRVRSAQPADRRLARVPLPPARHSLAYALAFVTIVFALTHPLGVTLLAAAVASVLLVVGRR
jgi:hypothetical protein